ncbi:MAG: carbon starvation protein A [Planctomycetota bacterium]
MSLLIAAAAFVLYLIAYNTYGRYLARRIFGLDPSARTPAHEFADGVDYVPSRKQIVFGHHFTSIAGTGPIVGPALAIIWGWLPALLWVTVGCIFMGAVHDLGALVVSMRHKGRSIADVCNELVNPRVRVLFLAIVTFGLIIVIAIFCLVIAGIFKKSPHSVIPVWCEVPIAIALGLFLRRAKSSASVIAATAVAVALMYFTVWVGYRVPVEMGSFGGFGPGFIWAIILLAYCFVASVLPVQTLLQPRDFINAYQLYIALALLAVGLLVTHPDLVAPAANMAPKLTSDPASNTVLSPWPLLFVVVACGAISGFHSLVAGGTTAKQLNRETDARAIGYGSMLMEGALAVLVIISVGAGLGLRAPLPDAAAFQKANPGVKIEADEIEGKTVSYVTGETGFNARYKDWKTAEALAVDSFMNGAGNMIARLGLPFLLCMTIMGVFVASFAGTTLDTATRLQRYIVSEFGQATGAKFLANRYVATFVTVVAAGVLALHDGKGAGALILWPLFGTLNQLIAALALMVVSVYLHLKGKPVWVTAIPFLIMVGLTSWAMAVNLRVFYAGGLMQLHLFVIGLIVAALEVWMIVEVVLHVSRRPQVRAHP